MIIELEKTDRINNKAIQELTLEDFRLDRHLVFNANRVFYREDDIISVFKNRYTKHGVFVDNVSRQPGGEKPERKRI